MRHSRQWMDEKEIGEKWLQIEFWCYTCYPMFWWTLNALRTLSSVWCVECTCASDVMCEKAIYLLNNLNLRIVCGRWFNSSWVGVRDADSHGSSVQVTLLDAPMLKQYNLIAAAHHSTPSNRNCASTFHSFRSSIPNYLRRNWLFFFRLFLCVELARIYVRYWLVFPAHMSEIDSA